MKKLLLTTLALAGTVALSSAQSRVAKSSSHVNRNAAIHQNFSSFKSAGQVCDTTSNFLSTYTPTIYNDQNGGYVSGQNSYADQSKADKFGILTPASYITGALYLFGVGTSSGTGQTFNAMVWDNDGTGGLPNTSLATQTVSYDTIAANVAALQPTFVDFNPDVLVSDTIYAGVNFAYNAGDTLALISSQDAEPTVNTAYEQFDVGDWYAFTDGSSWGLTLAHAIYILVCTPAGVNQLVSPSGELAVLPNPSSTGIFTIVVPNHNLNEAVSMTVYDTKGSQMYSIKQIASVNYTYPLNLAGLAKGNYVLKVETSHGVKTQKITIN